VFHFTPEQHFIARLSPFAPLAPACYRCFFWQKGQKCVLDQENTPAKGKEIRVIPVKICLLNARSMQGNTRYTLFF
jgi:hypothetical protein